MLNINKKTFRYCLNKTLKAHDGFRTCMKITYGEQQPYIASKIHFTETDSMFQIVLLAGLTLNKNL